MSPMNVVPKTGMSDVPFGMSDADLIELLGLPITEQTLNDVETHPKSRRVLNYVERGFLTTPELGVISIILDAKQTSVSLWDTEINSMNPSELAEFLAAKRCDVRMANPDGWGDQDVEALDHGIIASFCENRLESIEVHDSTWRDNCP